MLQVKVSSFDYQNTCFGSDGYFIGLDWLYVCHAHNFAISPLSSAGLVEKPEYKVKTSKMKSNKAGKKGKAK